MKTFLIFLIWAFWLSLEFLLGPYSHVRIHDAGDGFLPQAVAAKIQFENYGLSYFAPYMASGVDAHSQILVPFSSFNNLLLTILPGYAALGIIMFLQRFISSYFTFKLAHEILKIGFWQSIIAGLIFSLFNFSIFSFTFYHQGIAVLPLILYLLEKIFKRFFSRTIVYASVVGLLFGYVASFTYSSIYLLPFVFFWFLIFRKQPNLKVIITLLLFSLFTILVQFPTIYATVINSKFSQRTIWDSSVGIGPQGLTRSVVSDLSARIWANIVSAAIILLSFRYQKKWTTTAIIILVLPTIVKFSQVYLPENLGVMRTFSFERFDLLVPFALSLIAAACLGLILSKVKPAIRLFLVSSILAVLIASSFKIKIETLQNYAPYKNLYMHPQLVDLAGKIDSREYRVATITGGGVRSSFPLAYGLYTVDSYITLYPKNYHDFWRKVIAKRIENDKLRYDDFVKWGNRIYLYGPQDYNSTGSIEFQKYYDLDLLSFAGVKYIISQKPVSDENMSLLASNYREEFKDWAKFSKFQKIKEFLSDRYFGPPLYIYENKKALPRFFVLKNSEISNQQVDIRYYSPDQIILSAAGAEETTLVATINYYPWWKVTVNDEEVLVSKSQDTFMSFKIPAGENLIKLEYKAPYKLFSL